MEETLGDILRRSDVQYHVQKQIIKAKQDVVREYSIRVNSFYHSFAYHWIFHKRVFKLLQQDYEITERQFEVLMGVFAIANHWDCDGISGTTSLYETFFSDEVDKNAIHNVLTQLKKANLITSVTQSGLTAKNKIKLKSLRIHDERIIKLTDLGLEIPRRYNSNMGKELTNFTKKHGQFKESVLKILNWLIKMRKDMAGSDKTLRESLSNDITTMANS